MSTKTKKLDFRTFRCVHRHYPFICRDGGDSCSHLNCWMAARYGNNRVGYLDIECDNLDADFGIVLSWTLKERDNEELHSATISKEDVELSIELDKEVTDRRILQELQPLLGQFDYIVCHYGAMDRGLDIRFLRTRFVKLGLKFPVYGQMYAIDTFLMSKYKFKLHSNRLDTIAEYFGCPYQKTELKGDVWTLAKKGSSKALRYILDHNQKDVLILEWVHKKLEPYANLSKRSI